MIQDKIDRWRRLAEAVLAYQFKASENTPTPEEVEMALAILELLRERQELL